MRGDNLKMNRDRIDGMWSFLCKVINLFLYLLVLQVEALLLLSQQEERYYMESKSIQGLESQIKDLIEKITQVAHLPGGRFTWVHQISQT